MVLGPNAAPRKMFEGCHERNCPGHRRRRVYRQPRHKALAESGFTPVCYDTLEKGHAWAVRWSPLERGDIGNAARLEEVFARHKPRAIVHMAGYIEVGESVRQPDRYLHNNATKSEVLVAAAVRHRRRRLRLLQHLCCLRYAADRAIRRNAPHRPAQSLCRFKGRVETRSLAPPPRACVLHRFDISMPPAPTSTARSAKRTSRRRICCHWQSMRCWGSVLRSHCWATTIRRLMAPASAISSMSATWPMRISCIALAAARTGHWSARAIQRRKWLRL